MILTIIKNIKLMYRLEKKYKVECSFHYKPSSLCYYEHGVIRNKPAGEVVKKVSRVKMSMFMLCSSTFEMSLLHELGHALHPFGTNKDEMVAELAAWDWAWRHKEGKVSQQEILYYYSCINSYIAHLEKVEDKAFYIDRSGKLLCESLLGVKL